MKARRLMTRDVVCVAPETALMRVQNSMDELGVRHMPVVESGKLVGILSDRDLLLHMKRRIDGKLRLDACTAADAMTPRPITVLPDATIATVAQLMLEHRIDSVPIVSATHTLVGLITSSDLLSLLTEPEQESEVLPFSFALRNADETIYAA